MDDDGYARRRHRLSDDARARIAELWRRAEERGGNAADVVAMLERVVDAAEPMAIPHVIALALDDRRDVAEAAGAAVKRLRDRVDVGDWALFDPAFRSWEPLAHPAAARWAAMAPDELRRVARLAAGPTLLQLAMCHPSGYVREAAIRRSATCADGSEVAVFLLRVNDWVQPVRAAAETALRARLTPVHAPDLVAALPIIDAMHGWGRLGPGGMLREIEHALADPSASAALLDGTRAADRRVRRGAFRRLLAAAAALPSSASASTAAAAAAAASASSPSSPARAGGPAPAPVDVITAALRDRDPSIRAAAGRWLLAAPPAVFDPFRDALLRSRIAAIRFGAAQRVMSTGGALPWQTLLFDVHGGVRALAQTAALDAGADPDELYRQRVASRRGAGFAVAFLGLAETGGPRDAALARAHVRDPSAPVRASALRALCRLDADDAVAPALAALRDENLGVLRAAGELLTKHIAAVPKDDVWPVFLDAPSPAARLTALGVLYRAGFWESLPYLVRAFDAGDDAARARVTHYLTRWFARRARIFVAPPPPLAASLRAALHTSTLPDRLRRALVHTLDTYAP